MSGSITNPVNHPGALDDVLRDALPQPREELKAQRVQSVTEKAARRADAPAMLLKQKEGNVLDVHFAHAEADTAGLLLMADMGTCDAAFIAGILNQIAVIGTPGRRFDETASNFLLAVARAVAPKDELEAMLAVQMGAIHSAMMAMATRLNTAQTLPQQDVAERALNKLARTYTMQIEALKRYRTGGQQRVIVEHVTVNAGGQAIVGAVTTEGGGGCMKMNDNPMHPTQRLQNAPRCTATAKSTSARCRAPAVNGWSVCRMHGARGGAPSGSANGRWNGGTRTQELVTMRRLATAIVRHARDAANALAR